MRRAPWILLFSLCLVPQALAAEPNSVTDNSERKSELSADLKSFVRGAIDEGLLTPVGPKPAGSGEPQQADNYVRSEGKNDTPVRRQVTQADYNACEEPYALDFSSLQGISRYQEIFQVREKAGSKPDNVILPHEGGEMAKAYIALGLYPEAIMRLKRESGPQGTPYIKLASLMENRTKPDVDFFMEMASCREDSVHWLALAQLVAGQSGATENLQNALTGFRKLPLQLRIDYAAISIPELDRLGELGMARKLMADFDEDQVANSSELKFVSALVKLDSGDSAAERTIIGFLDHPQFQEPALAAMLRRKQTIDPAYEDILLGDLMQKFGQDNNDKSLAASLQFALQELSARSSYQPLMDLAKKPALQTPEAQAEVKRQLVSSLDRDLGSDDPLRNLAAINALAAESGLLDNEPSRDGLYKRATERAVHFGFGSMVSQLGKTSVADEDVTLKVARLALLRHDYKAVYALADSHPHNEHINVLAAKSAIREQNVAILRLVEDRLSLEPESVLALIEQDAVSGHWIVSDRVYEAAGHLTGTDHQNRVTRVTNLKRAARGDEFPTELMSITRVSELLNPATLASTPSSRGSN